MSIRDRLQRRVVPRLVVALSTVRAPYRWAAALRRALGGSGVVRLYVAFDDPYSAVALLGLAEQLDGRRVRLIVEPVVERGIPGDPAVGAKREYAITDSRRLARRIGLELSRSEPIRAGETAPLARQAAAFPPTERLEFSLAAMRRLWFEPGEPLEAVQAEADGKLPAEKGMKRRRLYDTPVAVLPGQWYFAHERLDQIAFALDELGWAKP